MDNSGFMRGRVLSFPLRAVQRPAHLPCRAGAHAGDAPQLLLARDRLGQKPLFYAQTNTGIVFASEIKSILAGDRGDWGLDLESLHHYLSLRFVPSPRTMLRGIAKLPPAHCLVLQDGDLRIFRYWQLDFREKLSLS